MAWKQMIDFKLILNIWAAFFSYTYICIFGLTIFRLIFPKPVKEAETMIKEHDSNKPIE
jgi:hypothetical protein